MSEYVFVYGTLKRGGINERLMEGTEYVADGVIPNAGLLAMPGYPGLLLGKCPEDMYARGEIYRIEGTELYESSASMNRDRVLATLDTLEQEGLLYKRVVVPVLPIAPDESLDADRKFMCWAYILLMDLPPHRLIRGGNWEMGDDIECLG